MLNCTLSVGCVQLLGAVHTEGCFTKPVEKIDESSPVEIYTHTSDTVRANWVSVTL